MGVRTIESTKLSVRVSEPISLLQRAGETPTWWYEFKERLSCAEDQQSLLNPVGSSSARCGEKKESVYRFLRDQPTSRDQP